MHNQVFKETAGSQLHGGAGDLKLQEAKLNLSPQGNPPLLDLAPRYGLFFWTVKFVSPQIWQRGSPAYRRSPRPQALPSQLAGGAPVL